ncbi:MAG: GHKL domain-containing protein [Saprospiraceae bacterium]|nr:GHKL domain-containing protein [Saprospiraceae bacterium]
MNIFKIFKNKIILFLILSLIFVFVANFITELSTSEKHLKRISSNFEKQLLKKDKILERSFYDFETVLKENKKNPHFDLIKQNFSYDQDGIIILVYSNDTLKYWSDNSVPVYNISDLLQTNETIKFLENGWFYLKTKKIENYTIFGAVLLKSIYPYQNDYLINEFQKDFKLAANTEISLKQETYQIHSANGKFLLSLNFPKVYESNELRIFSIFVLYLLAFLFFVAFLYHSHKRLNPLKNKPLFFVITFTFDLLLVRAAIFYFKIPTILYNSEIFSSAKYATSWFLTSLGDLLINSIVLLIIAVVVFKDLDLSRETLEKKLYRKYFALITLVIHICIFYKILINIIKGLILNSSISLDLSNILNISIYSVIGYIIISTLIISYFLISLKLFERVYKLCKSFKQYLIVVAFLLSVSWLVYFKSEDCLLVYLIFLFVFCISLWFFKRRFSTLLSFSGILFFLILFSLLATFLLYNSNNYKEKEKRKLYAINLAVQQDPVAEFLFKNIENKIYKDEYLNSLIQKDTIEENEIIDYVLQSYFNEYWKKYKFTVTICSNVDSLLIKPNYIKTNCHEFFERIIRDIGKMTFSKNLFYLDDNSWENNYIAILKFERNSNGVKTPLNFILELNSKYIPKDLGYPELLIDGSIKLNKGLKNYSYARFEKGDLISNYGKFLYRVKLGNNMEQNDTAYFYDEGGFSHFFYRVNKDNVLIISKKNQSYLDIIAPFSYLLFFFALFILILYLIINFPVKIKIIKLNFKNRLQMLITLLILFSFIIIGITTLYYIQNLNKNKNEDILREKMHSVLIEVEHKFSDVNTFTPEIIDYVKDILIKFSKVFFSDINLYDINGTLLATSRPELFEEKLISNKMNSKAYTELVNNNKTLFIHRENIGELKYLSAYIPFRNNQNKIVAYLNLPYFAKEHELISELSSFMVAFINIYVILIVISVFMLLLISNVISRPLTLIKEKIRHINLNETNEKIEWNSHDEIGELVHEYNRMIDELEKSAELLARSEREIAWREMAKQVAHEIKNPLTPMKLSVQYLEKAWADKVPDWGDRLKRFTNTIVEQIDSLSTIATEFSDFAKMPRSINEKVDLLTKINNAIEFYRDFDNLQIVIDKSEQGPYYVNIDKKQLLRVFNNLLKNSRQAIGDSKKGKIEIEIKDENGFYIVSVADNGAGIPKDKKEIIFQPYFTTKSSGMGLGLAMVKNIIDEAGGKIWFESEVGKGTTFYFSLPKLK